MFNHFLQPLLRILGGLKDTVVTSELLSVSAKFSNVFTVLHLATLIQSPKQLRTFFCQILYKQYLAYPVHCLMPRVQVSSVTLILRRPEESPKDKVIGARSLRGIRSLLSLEPSGNKPPLAELLLLLL